MLSGSSLTPTPNALDSARAICSAEYVSLHCPMSNNRGMPVPSMVPNSRSLKRYFPQASVRMTQSFGTFSASWV